MKSKTLSISHETSLEDPLIKTYGFFLYVTDINQLVEIDISTGKINKKCPVPGAKFLNDIVADKNGTIYFSDSSSKKSVIYIPNNNITPWFDQKIISKPNGLHIEGATLLVGNGGDKSLYLIDLKTKKIIISIEVGMKIDGLKPDGHGNYIISNWKGKTAPVNSSGEVKILLDTTDKKINSADLEFIGSRNLVLIPTFFNNQL